MRALLVALAVALALPAVASAHATLRSTTPKFGTEIKSSPAAITLTFDQTVTAVPGSMVVLNTHGKNFAGQSRIEGTNLVTPVRHLPTGAYTRQGAGKSSRTTSYSASPMPCRRWNS